MNDIKNKLMRSLAEVDLHVWCREPSLAGMVGRHVYMCMAKELNEDSQVVVDRSLKQIFQHPDLSDRAVRLKLRELEALGFIEIDGPHADRRARSYKPTAKLLDLYEQHAEKGLEVIAKHFYLIERVEKKE